VRGRVTLQVEACELLVKGRWREPATVVEGGKTWMLSRKYSLEKGGFSRG